MGDRCRRPGKPGRLLFALIKTCSLQFPQRPAYSFPMRPAPQQLTASTANKLLVQPTIRFGRDFFFESFFINTFKLTAAIHATRFACDEPKLAEHQH